MNKIHGSSKETEDEDVIKALKLKIYRTVIKLVVLRRCEIWEIMRAERRMGKNMGKSVKNTWVGR